MSFARPNGPGSGTCFGCFCCFANPFRVPRGSQHQVLAAFCRTPQVDERSFGGFSCSRGMQNLLVMESQDIKFQILSTNYSMRCRNHSMPCMFSNQCELLMKSLAKHVAALAARHSQTRGHVEKSWAHVQPSLAYLAKLCALPSTGEVEMPWKTA